MSRVLVCGGREYTDREYVFFVLDSLKIDAIIQGGANGADFCARCWAKIRGVSCIDVEANWRLHGKSAGPIRNAEMLTHKPDYVLAFPGGRGTQNMIDLAKAAGLRIIEVR